MTTILVALVLLCLMSGTAMAQEPRSRRSCLKILRNSRQEVLMITVEHAPGGSSAIHRHISHLSMRAYSRALMQLKGGQHVELLTPGRPSMKVRTMFITVDRNASVPIRRNSWSS